MTKADFLIVFMNSPKSNFIITTNIAVGRGINGVDYLSFIGAYLSNNGHCYNKIIGVNNDCVVLQQERNDAENYWKNGKRKIYVPLNNIVMVEILEEDCQPYRGEYPKELPFENYLGQFIPKSL